MMILKALDLQPLDIERKAITRPLSFQVHSGNVFLIKGENGSGKSTLLKVLLGLHKSFSGQFHMNLASSTVCYLPQLGNLQFHIPMNLSDFFKKESTAKSPLLNGLDLKKFWNTASGGERQKVLLATALEDEPRLLILDEPFNHIDEKSCTVIEQGLLEYSQTHPESAIVIVSHRSLTLAWQNIEALELP